MEKVIELPFFFQVLSFMGWHSIMKLFFHAVENVQIRGIYWRAEQKYRKYARVIAISYLIYDQSVYVTTFIYSICWILTGNLDASTWPVLVELSVPFGTNTIYGWYLLLLTTSGLDLAYLICIILSTTQFVGSCIHIAAMCEHFDFKMQTTQINIERKHRAMKIKKEICEAIQIHIKIYE